MSAFGITDSVCLEEILELQNCWAIFFPFIPFLQVMVCQLNEMLCKRPHTANIAIIFVGLVEIVIRINVPQDLDVYKYCFI